MSSMDASRNAVKLLFTETATAQNLAEVVRICAAAERDYLGGEGMMRKGSRWVFIVKAVELR